MHCIVFQQFIELLTPHQALFSSLQWCVKKSNSSLSWPKHAAIHPGAVSFYLPAFSLLVCLIPWMPKMNFEWLNTGSNSIFFSFFSFFLLFLKWKLLPYNTMHIMLFLALGLNTLIISCHFIAMTLMEFLDNCKNANGNQSLWNVTLRKINTMKVDKSLMVIILLIWMITIKKRSCMFIFYKLRWISFAKDKQ